MTCKIIEIPVSSGVFTDGAKEYSSTTYFPDRVSFEATNYQDVVLADSPTNYWPACEGIGSTIGNAVTGAAGDATATGGAWKNDDHLCSAGGSPSGRSNDGATKWFVPYDAGSMDYINWDEPFTIEMWFRDCDDTFNTDPFFQFGDDNVGFRLEWRRVSNTASGAPGFDAWFLTPSFNRFVRSNDFFFMEEKNKWRHLVFVHNPSPLRTLTQHEIWVDGVEIGMDTQSGNLTADFLSTAGLWIGGGDDAGEVIVSMWSDFAMYNTALTPTQIQAHYNAGVSQGVAECGEATYSGTISDGAEFPYGAELKKLMVDGHLARYPGELRSRYFISVDGGADVEIEPNGAAPSLYIPLGGTYDLKVKFYADPAFQSNCPAWITDSLRLVLDNQITTPITGGEGVPETVVEIVSGGDC